MHWVQDHEPHETLECCLCVDSLPTSPPPPAYQRADEGSRHEGGLLHCDGATSRARGGELQWTPFAGNGMSVCFFTPRDASLAKAKFLMVKPSSKATKLMFGQMAWTMDFDLLWLASRIRGGHLADVLRHRHAVEAQAKAVDEACEPKSPEVWCVNEGDVYFGPTCGFHVRVCMCQKKPLSRKFTWNPVVLENGPRFCGPCAVSGGSLWFPLNQPEKRTGAKKTEPAPKKQAQTKTKFCAFRLP